MKWLTVSALLLVVAACDRARDAVDQAECILLGTCLEVELEEQPVDPLVKPLE